MPTPELVLTVRRPPGQADVRRFRAGPVTVGREALCSIRLADREVSELHVRFFERGDHWEVVDPGSTHGTRIGRRALVPTRPQVVASGDALAVGPFLIEVFLDGGGGLTTDSRDTNSRARGFLSQARNEAGGHALWVLSGPGAGQSAALSPRKRLVVGRDAGCGLVLPGAGMAGRHFEVTVTRQGRLELTSLGGEVRVRGQAVRSATLHVEDHIAVGESVLQVRGPAQGQAARGKPGWTALEKGVLLVLVGSGFALAWAWLKPLLAPLLP